MFFLNDDFLLIANVVPTSGLKAVGPMRYSLRSLLVVLTIATIVFGYRYNQRRHLQTAATKIQEQGGTVFYSWQEPYVVLLPATVSDTSTTVKVPYEVVLANGDTVTKTRTEIAHRNVPIQVFIEEYRLLKTNSPRFNFTGFLFGSHDDVAVSAISIPLAAADQSMFKLLHQFKKLDGVLLCFDERYFQVKASSRLEAEDRNRKLLPYNQDLDRVTKRLEAGFPSTRIFRRGMIRDVR